MKRRKRSPKPKVSAAPADEQQITAAKFDLGGEVDGEAGEPLPWGYGECTIRALPLDPGRLFLYWEVTDEAIEAARKRLPANEADRAELCVRVYDTTGRIFDGTNAHRFVDVAVDRRQRQWFLEVPSPGSEHCAEVGLRAPDGAFARIARSLKAALPRFEPWPETTDAWMTVRPGADGRLQIQRFWSSAGVAPGEAPAESLTREEREVAMLASDVAKQRIARASAEAPPPGSSEQSQPRSEAPWRGSGQS